VAKIVVHAPDRDAAVDAMADALDRTRLEGVASNLDLLAAVVAEPAFRRGDLHTGFLDEHELVARLGEVDPRAVAGVAATRSLTPAATDGVEAGDAAAGPWSAGHPWRSAGVGERTRWIAGGRVVEATATTSAAWAATVGVDGAIYQATVAAATPGEIHLAIDGLAVVVHPATGGRVVDTAVIEGRSHRLRLAPPPSADRGADAAGDPGALVAPMPGRIVRVHVSEGDHVAANDPLLVLEAMKMEHVIAAAGAGRISRLLVTVGDQVARAAPSSASSVTSGADAVGDAVAGAHGEVGAR